MNRSTVGLVWVCGLVLMVALYAIGPGNFVYAVEEAFSQAWWFLDRLFTVLALQALDLVRAAAIALYVVFLALAIMARQRGHRTGGAIALVSLLFLFLVRYEWYAPGTRWFVAAVVCGVGAISMTSRLLRPPPPRNAGPWARPEYDGAPGEHRRAG